MHALCSENGDRLEIKTTPKNLADSVSLNQALGLSNKSSCSAPLSMKKFLFINVKIPSIVGILTFMSGKNIIGLSEPEKVLTFLTFYTSSTEIFLLSSVEKV